MTNQRSIDHNSCTAMAGVFSRVSTSFVWLVPAIFLLGQAPARAEIRAVTANPGEDCSTQMNIGWHADLTETSTSVVYTPKQDAAWAQAKEVPGKAKRSEVFDGVLSKTPDGKDWNEEAKFLDYGATLSGLTPDTDYMYKVVGAGGAGTSDVRY